MIRVKINHHVLIVRSPWWFSTRCQGDHDNFITNLSLNILLRLVCCFYCWVTTKDAICLYISNDRFLIIKKFVFENDLQYDLKLPSLAEKVISHSCTIQWPSLWIRAPAVCRANYKLYLNAVIDDIIDVVVTFVWKITLGGVVPNLQLLIYDLQIALHARRVL